MSASNRAAPFGLFAIMVIVVVAAVGFVAMMVLSAYAPEYRDKRNGGEHAYSTSAIGFVGISEIVRMTRGDHWLIRNPNELNRFGLVVLTPSLRNGPAEIKAILDRRPYGPTLIVMPKWIVRPLDNNASWVRAEGVLPGEFLEQMLDGIATAHFTDPGGGALRTIHGADFETIEATEDGQPLLIRLPASGIYILADPDVLNNKGIATRTGAVRATAMLDKIALPNGPIGFDVTLSGLGNNPNLLKLAFEPPFLPLTLCLLFAALLAGLQAMRRFGPPAQEERLVAYGKRALAENGAALLRLAKRRHRTGGRYAALTREAAAAATGAPASLSGDALDRYLDRLAADGVPFTTLAERADSAPDTRRLLAAARDLYHWRRTVTREHR